MKTQPIKVEDIQVSARLRQNVCEATVVSLVESIRTLGLQSPIAIRYEDGIEIEGDLVDGVPMLVSGRHRLEALRRLLEQHGKKYKYTDCIVFDDSTNARLWEISENLHRVELTVQERADQIAEWVRITSERTVTTCDSSKPGPKGAERAAARELGLGRMDVNRAFKIAAIVPEAKEAARAAGVTTQKALLEVASAPEEEQVEKALEIAERKAKSGPKRAAVMSHGAFALILVNEQARELISMLRAKLSPTDFERAVEIVELNCQEYFRLAIQSSVARSDHPEAEQEPAREVA